MVESLMSQVESHADWSILDTHDREAYTLLVLGRFQDIVDRGLATRLEDALFDGLLDDAFSHYDRFCDANGYEL